MSPEYAPGYWMNETSGVLSDVVERYITSRPLSAGDIATMRAYVRQWMAGDFVGPEVDELRESIDTIVDRATLDAWMERAIDAEVDPL
jgi:hypothetical protein